MLQKGQLRGLYAITDPVLLPAAKLFDGVAEALLGGAKLIQYRDKHASDAERLERAKVLQQMCAEYAGLLIINDDVELCLQSGAGGVHLGRSDGDIAQARAKLGENRILGVTCHDDLAYARQATALGADYVAFGRLFPSHTKPDAPACPLDRLRDASKEGLCTVAIGGITLDNAPAVLDAGATMLALIHDLFSQKDIRARAAQYSALFR